MRLFSNLPLKSRVFLSNRFYFFIMLDPLFQLFITEETRADVNKFAKAKNIVLLATSLASLNAFFAVYSLIMSLPQMMVITCTTAVLAYMIPLFILRMTQSELPPIFWTGSVDKFSALYLLKKGEYDGEETDTSQRRIQSKSSS
jgi:hypothetical protein